MNSKFKKVLDIVKPLGAGSSNERVCSESGHPEEVKDNPNLINSEDNQKHEGQVGRLVGHNGQD